MLDSMQHAGCGCDEEQKSIPDVSWATPSRTGAQMLDKMLAELGQANEPCKLGKHCICLGCSAPTPIQEQVDLPQSAAKRRQRSHSLAPMKRIVQRSRTPNVLPTGALIIPPTGSLGSTTLGGPITFNNTPLSSLADECDWVTTDNYIDHGAVPSDAENAFRQLWSSRVDGLGGPENVALPVNGLAWTLSGDVQGELTLRVLNEDPVAFPSTDIDADCSFCQGSTQTELRLRNTEFVAFPPSSIERDVERLMSVRYDIAFWRSVAQSSKNSFAFGSSPIFDRKECTMTRTMYGSIGYTLFGQGNWWFLVYMDLYSDDGTERDAWQVTGESNHDIDTCEGILSDGDSPGRQGWASLFFTGYSTSGAFMDRWEPANALDTREVFSHKSAWMMLSRALPQAIEAKLLVDCGQANSNGLGGVDVEEPSTPVDQASGP